MLSKYGMRDYDAFAATQIRGIAGIVCFVLLFTVLRRWSRFGSIGRDRRSLGLISLGAFFGPFLGVSLSLLAVQHTATGVAATIMAIVPVLIIAPAVIVFREKLTAREVVGAVLVRGPVDVGVDEVWLHGDHLIPGRISIAAIASPVDQVTVQPGISWKKLDEYLTKHGMTLRLYPSSFPSSTVGGWLAQGGAGIGSFEAGWFRDNVVSARVVLTDGEVREFRGDELDVIDSAGGITGLISEVTIGVQPLEDLEVAAIACISADSLQRGIERIIERKLPIWSLVFINPRMAELKNEAPLREHLDLPVEERVTLPDSYITSVAFRKKDREAIMSELPEIMNSCGGQLLSDEIARHEWDKRFKIMLVKRLGPSLVPAEVVVPLSSLGKVMKEIESKVDQPVVKEGVAVRQGRNGQPEVVILGFIPSDQRKFNYNFVFGLTLTIMKIAEKYGGRPYSTGLYFAGRADSVLGKDKVKRLKAFKAKTLLFIFSSLSFSAFFLLFREQINQRMKPVL